MKIKDFGVEQWMNAYETKAVYNLGETCISPFSIKTLGYVSLLRDKYSIKTTTP